MGSIFLGDTKMSFQMNFVGKFLHAVRLSGCQVLYPNPELELFGTEGSVD
jgi:hypothetical protein